VKRFFRQFKKIFDLSWVIARLSFKLKNEGTWLGIFWYLLSPLLTFSLLLVIFNDRLGTAIPQYPLYLLLGIIIFNFFQKITDESINIFLGAFQLIKSINFPREALIASVVIKTLLSHLFEIVVLIGFLFFFHIPIKTMVFYPIILFFLSIFSFGSALLLATIKMYIFDLDMVWGFASRLIWFATPIFYAIEGQDRLGNLNLFNPIFYFITASRDLVIYARLPEPAIIIGVIGYSLSFLLIGFWVFKKFEKNFAELV
jgi:lipopolysaccharide transport system permease protein